MQIGKYRYQANCCRGDRGNPLHNQSGSRTHHRDLFRADYSCLTP